DSVLSLNHAKYGLHAGGALPFFLPKFIGPGKAAEYVFNGGEISAKEALEIGLINKILSEENFDETCVNETKILCQYDSRYIRWTKDLLTTYKTELIDYLHKEEKFIEHY
ncbi:MAG: enoyl-CoA hydratase/isomerase family protein, partial [Ignavibacteria bacterium]|nr:enoyl-CoA hydratase/isomerase family protein [Ignavibacteria bacterium]